MKIKAIILSAVLLLNMLSFSAFAQSDIADSDYEHSADFLAMLGITDGIDTSDASRRVSRAEFAAMTVNMTNLSTVTTDADEFLDVDISDGFGSKIYDALYLGIVSEAADGMFRPNDDIAYEPAVKMVVEGLGYGQKARIYGGYPTGYLRLASELGILSGVDKAFCLDDAISLVANALTCEVWIINGVSDDVIDYKTSPDRTLLTENFGLSHTNGIVYTAGIYSANYAYDSVVPSIEIGGKKYDCSIEGVEKYLGYSVDAWYDKDGRVTAIYASGDNNEITINGKDVLDYSDLKLTVESGNKEKKYNLSGGYTYILNGRLHDQTNADFMFENGTLTLIDNSGDGKYDFVVADRYEFFRVASIDELSRIIYDNTNGNSNIEFSNLGDSYYEFDTYNVAKGTRISSNFDAVTAGALLEIKQSGDGQVISVTILTGNGVSGTVEEIGTDYIVVNGESYKLSDYFVANGEVVSAGIQASFLLSSDKRIVAKTDSGSTMLYGYYLDFKKSSGFEKAQIKLLTTDNTILTYPVADKVKVNNASALVNANDLYSDLIYDQSQTPIYQVIKYSANANGELKAIDFAADAPSDGIIVTDGIDGDSLLRYASKEPFMYKSSGSLIVPFGKIVSNTAVFSVPFDLTKEGKADFVYERYDDENFACVGTTRLKNDLKGSTVNQTDYRIDVYDYNKNYIPSAVTVYDMTGGGVTKKIAPVYSAESNMVDSVTNALDSDENETVKITLCALSGYNSYLVNSEVYEELKKDNDIPVKGDIIRYNLNAKNEIVGIARDVVPSADKKSFTVNFESGSGENFLSSDISYRFSYGVGRVKNFGEGLLTLQFINTPTSWGTNVSASDKLSFASGATKAVLYSGERNPVRVINAADIKTEANCGAGDVIVGRTTYYNMTTIFVYRAE
ncbi:MAG: hypothetical protein J6B23_08075 [Clostridia bacterium]|nr:hypothetical protein [Clostridia bacterium]